MRQVYIAPSLLAANKSDLENEIKRISDLKAPYLHFDVMDDDFIGHTSFSFADYEKIKKMHNLINDVHLMVAKPYAYAREYAAMGANYITFHYEALKDDVMRFDCIDAIRQLGVKVGMSIKPKTPIEKILPFLHLLDLVLIMSVEPGKGGQSFMPNALEKISVCHKFIDENNLKTLIEVDGGLNENTGPACYYSGADILVMGTYLFGHQDIAERYHKVLKACQHD